MNRPNLFSFATSELSQDAFICWLLSWASPEYKNADYQLHQCAFSFIKSLFEKHRKTAPSDISKIEVKKQDSNIDVLCIINDEYAILIEDKIGTKNHTNQLVRYLEEIKDRKFKEDCILPTYYKTEDQGDYSEVLEASYKLFLRSDILRVLNGYEGINSIVTDYRDHLQSISDDVESFKSRPINEWGWYSWVGFYLRLQKELGDGNWDYVPNPNGGFLGMWWHFQGDEKCEQYLQLEEDKLCFKIWVDESQDRIELRSMWHSRVKEKGTEFDLLIERPTRFGNGKYMTVCIYDGEYRITDGNGVINFDRTLKRLKKAEELLKSVDEYA